MARCGSSGSARPGQARCCGSGCSGASQGRLGNFATATDTAQKACLIADEVRRPADIALAYWWAGFVSGHKGDIPDGLAISGARIQRLPRQPDQLSCCRSSRPRWAIPMRWPAAPSREYRCLKGHWHSIAAPNSLMARPGRASIWVSPICSTIATRECSIMPESILELARKHKYRAIEVDALLLLGDVHRNPSAPAREEAERCYSQACDLSSRTRVAARICALPDGSWATAHGIGAPGEGRAADRFGCQLCRSMGMVETAIQPGRAAHLNSSDSEAAVS